MIPILVLLLAAPPSPDSVWMKPLAYQLIDSTDECSRAAEAQDSWTKADLLRVNREQFLKLDAYRRYLSWEAVASDPCKEALAVARIDVSILCLNLLRPSAARYQRPAHEAVRKVCTLFDLECPTQFGSHRRDDNAEAKAERERALEDFAQMAKTKIESEKKEAADQARRYLAEHPPDAVQAKAAAVLARDQERAAANRLAVAAFSAYSLCSSAQPGYGAELSVEKAATLGKRFVAAFAQEQSTANQLSQTTTDPEVRQVLDAAETIYQYCRELTLNRSVPKSSRSKADAARVVLNHYRP